MMHLNGLLFYAYHEKLQDYIALLLVEGYVWLRFNARDDETLVKSTEAVPYGKVSTVEIN